MYERIRGLREDKDLSQKEIAEILHLRPTTVGSRLHRGKEKLKTMMGGTFNETL